MYDSRANSFDNARAASRAAATSSNDAEPSEGGASGTIGVSRRWFLSLHFDEQKRAVERLASNGWPHSSHTFIISTPISAPWIPA